MLIRLFPMQENLKSRGREKKGRQQGAESAAGASGRPSGMATSRRKEGKVDTGWQRQEASYNNHVRMTQTHRWRQQAGKIKISNNNLLAMLWWSLTQKLQLLPCLLLNFSYLPQITHCSKIKSTELISVILVGRNVIIFGISLKSLTLTRSQDS